MPLHTLCVCLPGLQGHKFSDLGHILASKCERVLGYHPKDSEVQVVVAGAMGYEGDGEVSAAKKADYSTFTRGLSQVSDSSCYGSHGTSTFDYTPVRVEGLLILTLVLELEAKLQDLP